GVGGGGGGGRVPGADEPPAAPAGAEAEEAPLGNDGARCDRRRIGRGGTGSRKRRRRRANGADHSAAGTRQPRPSYAQGARLPARRPRGALPRRSAARRGSEPGQQGVSPPRSPSRPPPPHPPRRRDRPP